MGDWERILYDSYVGGGVSWDRDLPLCLWDAYVWKRFSPTNCMKELPCFVECVFCVAYLQMFDLRPM